VQVILILSRNLIMLAIFSNCPVQRCLICLAYTYNNGKKSIRKFYNQRHSSPIISCEYKGREMRLGLLVHGLLEFASLRVSAEVMSRLSAHKTRETMAHTS
jgi:hypothetical protein